MAYTKLTDFAVKDALLTGNPAKVVRGTEVDAEFNAIAAADALNLSAASIVAATSKATPIDADLIPLIDSAASNVLKKLTWANLKATLLTWLQGTVLPSPGPIGSTTPSTGAFTTLSASGDVNVGAPGVGSNLTLLSAGANLQITPNNASGANGVDYKTSFTAGDAGPHVFKIGGTECARIASTGLAVTGTLSATGATGTLNVTSSTLANPVVTLADSAGRTAIFSGPTSPGIDYARIGTTSAHNLSLITQNTVKVTLDTSGNLGIGVTPSAWNTSWKAIDIGSQSSISNVASGTRVTQNGYASATGDRYKTTAAASIYNLAPDGSHQWYTAPSGTAGNAISFTQAMTLDASANLAVAGSVTIGSYTTATRPAHTAGKMIYVSDGGGGAVFQGSNGSAWVNLG